MKKSSLILQILFIVINVISGVYYIHMGQWKARVALFGMISLLIALIATVAFVFSVVKRRSFNVLLATYGIFCLMQLFPMVEGFMLGGQYVYNGISHVIVLGIGMVCVLLSLKKLRQRQEM